MVKATCTSPLTFLFRIWSSPSPISSSTTHLCSLSQPQNPRLPLPFPPPFPSSTRCATITSPSKILLHLQSSTSLSSTPQFDGKMNGYSKMLASADITTKSGSTDSSDLTLSPEPKEAQEHPHPTPEAQQGEADAKVQDHFSWQEGGQRRGGVTLSRNCSSASQRFRASGTTGRQAMARRAFSMRKPSSGAGGYWRIHDTGDGDRDGDEEFAGDGQQQMRFSRKKGKILKACKKLFGF